MEAMVDASLDHFYLSRYRVRVTAHDPLHLPAFKGTTLRGSFGLTFRRMVCYQPQTPTCDNCLLRYTCPYPALFNTYTPPDSEVLSREKNIPLPLVIEPPLDEQQVYEPGEELVFHLTLIGQSVRYLSYLVVALQEAGWNGLGRDRGRFQLRSLEAVHPYDGSGATVYDAAQSRYAIHAQTLPVRFAECRAAATAALKGKGIRMRFLTPLRLRQDGSVMRGAPPFHSLWGALMRRVSALAYFHCGARWTTDYRQWALCAQEVATADVDTQWVARDRFSSRQRQFVPIGGETGAVTYLGDLEPFLPVLELGRWVHVGKATVFGNGQYTLLPVEA